jgi:hypothetical protein
MRGWLVRFSGVTQGAITALERFPVALIALAAFALFNNLAISEVIRPAPGVVERAGMALIGAAIIATAFVLLAERHGLAFALRHGGSILLAAIVGASLWLWEGLAVAWPALFAAAVLAVPLAPYVRRSPQGFWDFIWRLVQAGTLAFVAVVVFCVGLSAIFASVDYLFGFPVDGSVYAHVWSIGLVFIGPLAALSLVPADFPESDGVGETDLIVVGVRLLADYVAVPLLAVFALIIHLYALKIAVTAEWPKNQIGWMVLAFGLAVLAVRILFHPFSHVGLMPSRLFLRWWAPPLVVPLLLLVVAVWQRISDVGVTPDRYGLALFALFLGLVLAAQLYPRLRGDIRVIPAFGALCLLLASFGPWSIIPVSTRSQTERLIERLSAAGLLDGPRLSPGLPKWERSEAEDVLSIVEMLHFIGQLDDIRPLFTDRTDDPFTPHPGDADSREAVVARVRQILNVATLPPRPNEAADFNINDFASGSLAIGGYDVIAAGLDWATADTTLATDGTTLRVRIIGSVLEISVGAAGLRITPDMLRSAITERLAAVETQPGLGRPPFLVELTMDGRRVGLLFSRLGGKMSADSLSISYGDFALLLRREDWPD